MLTKQDIQILKETFFDPINGKFEGIEKRLDRVEGRLDGVERRLDRVDKRLDDIDKRFATIEIQLTSLDSRLMVVEEMLEDHNSRIMTLQDVVVGISNYIQGELTVYLHSLEKKDSFLEKRILHLGKGYGS
ncbi:hypothetical protein HYV12_04375 [Candidatus Dojkabacteria bacterium]|nr:hypothetical protein [Candidatus Dojkabacteria bacterium]